MSDPWDQKTSCIYGKANPGSFFSCRLSSSLYLTIDQVSPIYLYLILLKRLLFSDQNEWFLVYQIKGKNVYIFFFFMLMSTQHTFMKWRFKILCILCFLINFYASPRVGDRIWSYLKKKGTRENYFINDSIRMVYISLMFVSQL